MRIYALGGTVLAPTLTSLLYQNTGFSGRAVRWNKQYPDVVAIGFNVAGTNSQVYRYNAGANTLTLLASTSGPQVLSVDWTNDGSCLMLGASGAVILYAYDNTTGSLGLCCQYNATNGVSSRYSPVNNYVSQIRSSSPSILNIYRQSRKSAFFQDLYINLNNDLLLQNCNLTFLGNCTIFGNGHTLDLTSSSTLTVATYANLTLNNLTLRGLQTSNLNMLAPSSQLILEDVRVLLDDNFTFSQGALVIADDVTISGKNLQFIYTTTATSNILADSRLILDDQLTFSYNPGSADKNLLQFADPSAQLVLRGATLAATTTGLNLLRGTLVVENNSYFSSSATLQSQAISLGSGSSTCDNMGVQITPAAVLEVLSGILVNNNI